MNDVDWSQRLQAYHDGELGRWGRWRVERRLRGSASLRQELSELRELSALLGEIEHDDAARPADLWSSVAPGLTAIDREIAGGEIVRPDLSAWWSPSGWQPIAVAMAALLLVLLATLDFDSPIVDNGAAPPTEVVASGSLRYLKTDGRPFVVSENEGGATIIWLMEQPGEA